MVLEKIRVGLLCNNKMAMPTMQRLMGEGVLCSVATADTDAEVLQLFGMVCKDTGMPYLAIGRKTYKEQLGEWLLAEKPDVVMVMTFPWRITAELLAVPRLGFLNFHFGLLPEMRGADPIFESIRQRLPVVGATVHVMDEGLDTGPIVLREELPALSPEFTYGMLSGQMALLGERMCAQVLALCGQGQAMAATRQDDSKAKYWPKVNEAAITIQWDTMDIGTIMALVRSCNPIGKGVPTTINGWKIGVVDVSEVALNGNASPILPGTIIALDAQHGLVVCGNGGRALKLEVVYTSEGVLPGYKLGFFGVQCGMVFL
jgi:methionyl-tRNA formyltransferase